MKVLVTGGAGFIGSWVAQELLSQNHEVWVLDNLSTGKESNLDDVRHTKGFKSLVIGDVRSNSLVTKVFKNRFDICIHLASAVHVHESMENPKKYFDINLMGTLNLLEQARKYNTKFVFVSTCMVYDKATDKLISEDHPTKPSSPYVASKIAAENLVRAYYNTYSLPSTILRPFNTYGPRQPRYYEGLIPTFMGVIPNFIHMNLKGESLKVYGYGTQTRDFMYIKDCADFIVRASVCDRSNGEILNAGSGEDISIDDLALLISREPKRIEHIAHHHPQSEIQKLVCDYSKAKEMLGWEPKTPLQKGLKETEEWIKNAFFKQS